MILQKFAQVEIEIEAEVSGLLEVWLRHSTGYINLTV